MNSSRRSFLKGAGRIGAVAVLGGLNTVTAKTKPAGQQKTGLARGLTLLTMRRNGEYCLGAKTSKGILDVREAAGLLKVYSPATLDDMLQREEGASVQAVVEAAMKSNAAHKLFLREENIEYGPLVTRPEKIVCRFELSPPCAGNQDAHSQAAGAVQQVQQLVAEPRRHHPVAFCRGYQVRLRDRTGDRDGQRGA